MLSKSDVVNFYKRKEIQEAIVAAAKNREVAVRYGEGFGKRPDTLKFCDEVVDLALQGATSFHASEELWENPRLISSEMKRSEIEKLRIGWDLILDIDAPEWEISKITAWLIITALQDFGISSISVKFSGNKGFHIGVPFEAFPTSINKVLTKSLFPDAARSIAAYLLEFIADKYISLESNDGIIFGAGLSRRFKVTYEKLQQITGKPQEEITHKICQNCSRKIEGDKIIEKIEFLCRKCGGSLTTAEDAQYQKCQKCDILMERISSKKSICECGSDSFFRKFNPLSVIEVDTILISTRHLFRMPYSLHEKSGLVSIPFNPEKILAFEKKYASPDVVKVSKHVFIDRDKARPDEAKRLIEAALFHQEKKQVETSERKKAASFEAITEAIPEDYFPPCIKKVLTGLLDGKKRALFMLINFLRCAGWSNDMITERIHKWNEGNPEPLKETIIQGQLRYHLRGGEKVLPPNCDKTMYYKDMQICVPDGLCRKIKNPVNYSILKVRIERKRRGKENS
jgi:DNA primase catalytic subunit